jgi:hypothetical protein
MSGTGREAEDQPTPRIVLVSVLGLVGDDLTGTIDTVAGRSRSTGVVPVFITDQSDFAPFRRRRVLFEYLPAAPERTVRAPSGMDRHYEPDRMREIKRKWSPVTSVSFGRKPVGSPFA